MHIILGFLSSIVTILWLLHRLAEMGIDLGGLNPWSWQRRRKFRAAYQGDPIYTLEDPMEAVAVLLVAVAKADGDMSHNERQELLSIFTTNFHLSQTDASSLLGASTHLYGSGDSVRSSLEKVLQPSAAKFSPTQAQSAIEMLEHMGSVDEQISDAQNDIINRARTTLLGRIPSDNDRWS
ncbi:MAG: TerB family tellurite resistance protein [Pseudomonadota bacterium]